MSTSSKRPPVSPLEADAGALATHFHHSLAGFLMIAAPVYLYMPTSESVDKVLGTGLAVVLSAHSWIGWNYVAADYVPKISKSLLGPARFVTAGFGLVTLLGLGSIALNNKGGIKGCISALWTTKKKTK